MHRSKIEWVKNPDSSQGYTWWVKNPYQIKKPVGIFLDDMSDWMGDYWPREWTEAELQVMRDCPQHRFYTLTKQPQNLPKWSPFPDNCRVGATVCNQEMANKAIPTLMNIPASKRYISIEPMLEPVDLSKVEFGRYLPEDKPYFVNALEDRYIFGDEGDIELKKIDWLIIGACTGTLEAMVSLADRLGIVAERIIPLNNRRYTLQPKIEWVKEIVEAADRAGIPVFLKDNLKPSLFERLELPRWARTPHSLTKLRQEIPLN